MTILGGDGLGAELKETKGVSPPLKKEVKSKYDSRGKKKPSWAKSQSAQNEREKSREKVPSQKKSQLYP